MGCNDLTNGEKSHPLGGIITVPPREYRLGYDSDVLILDVKPETSIVIFRYAREKTAGLLNCDIDAPDFQEKAREMYSELRRGMAGDDLEEEPDSLELVVVSNRADELVALLNNFPFLNVNTKDMPNRTSGISYSISNRKITTL